MMLERITASVFGLLAMSMLLLTSGCAAKASRMVPTDFEVAYKHLSTVRVNESVGGKETNPLGSSQISNAAFTEALRIALIRSGLFQNVVKDGQADYILDVTILHYNEPRTGTDFYITIRTKWELTDARTQEPVWLDTFETTYREGYFDTFMGPQRLQRANEGAVRINLWVGIRKISLLNLKS